MVKIDYNKIQVESEIDCVERFIPTYNMVNNSNYGNPVKNEIQDEIDIFCFDGFNELKIQVKKADRSVSRHLGISPGLPLDKRCYIRDSE